MTTPINLNAYFSRTDIHVEGDVMCMKPQDLPFEELGKARSLIWCADFASSGDRAARGFTADQMTCFECKREPVAVEFSDYDRGGYPRNAWRLCARLVCGEHGQEMAYWAHLGGSLRGGMSWAEDWGADNLQTLCEPCNAAKADRDPHAHDLTAGRE